jgi:hypothetical protein
MTGLYFSAALLFDLRASAAILDQRIVQDRWSESHGRLGGSKVAPCVVASLFALQVSALAFVQGE